MRIVDRRRQTGSPFLLAILMAMFAVFGCDDGGGGTTVDASNGGTGGSGPADVGQPGGSGGAVEPVLQALRIAPTEARIDIDQSYQLTAIGTFDNGLSVVMTNKLDWTSSNPAVVSVTDLGLLTGHEAGQAQIAATLGDIAAPAVSVTVLPAAPPPPGLESIKLLPAQLSLNIGESFQFAAIGHYDDGHDDDLTDAVIWKSTPPDVVSIDADGVARALGAGDATVTATLGSITSTPTPITVERAALITIELDPAAATLHAASLETVQFTAVGVYADGARLNLDLGLVWTSDDPTVASVDETGLVMPGDEPGLAHLTAALGDVVSAPALLTVLPSVKISAIELAPESPSLFVGDLLQVMATVTFADGRRADGNQLVEWASENEQVAAVGPLGLVTGVSVGETNIVATAGDVSASLLVAITRPQAVELSIDPEHAALPAGTTQQFDATALFEDGSVRGVGDEVEWSSDDDAIVMIDAQGLAVAQAVGQTEIRARLGDVEATASFVVTPAVPVRVELDPAAPDPLALGRTLAFSATGIFTDGASRDLTDSVDLTWASTDPDVARISNAGDSRGVATGLAEGVTFISATFRAGVLAIESDPVQLTIVPATVEALEMAPNNPVIPRDFPVQFRLSGRFTDGHVHDLTVDAVWTSSNPQVAVFSAAIDERGLATGVAAGVTTIRATYGALMVETQMRVTAATLTSISISPPTRTVALGGSARFMARGNFSDGSTQDLTREVTWSIAPEDLGRGVSVSNASEREGLVTVAPNARPSLDPVTLNARFAAIVGVAEVTIVAPLRLVAIQVDAYDSNHDEVDAVPVGLTAQVRALGLYYDGVHPAEALDITEFATFNVAPGGYASISNAADTKGVLTALRVADLETSTPVEVNACYQDVCARDPDPDNADNHVARILITNCAFNAMQLAPDERNLPRGMTRQYRALAMYAGQGEGCADFAQRGYDVTPLAQWYTSNPLVATVTSFADRGRVTAAASPPSFDVQITARFRDLEGRMDLHVIDACVASLSLAPGNLSLPAGVRQAFIATARLTNGADVDFTDEADWSVTGPLDRVRPGVVQTYAGGGQVGTVTATSPASEVCESRSARVTITIDDSTLTAMTLQPERIDLAIGACFDFGAMGQYDGRRFSLTEQATWTSSSPAVATAAPNGRVCGRSAGSVVILATYANVTGTARVVVGGRQLTQVQVDVEPTFACGDFGGGGHAAGVEFPMRAYGLYSDGSRELITGQAAWTSGTPAVATIDATGMVTTIDGGNTVITARFGGMNGTFNLAVADATLRAIDVTPGNGFVIELNATRQFTAMGEFQAAFGNPAQLRIDHCDVTDLVNWGAAPAPSLVIDPSGLAHTTGVASPAATITANRAGVVATVRGEVRGQCIRGISVRPGLVSAAVGVNTQFLASVILSDGSTRDVTLDPIVEWLSSNPAVAVVQRGVATPLAPGEARITARYDAGEAACDDVALPLVASGVMTARPAAIVAIDVTCDRPVDWPNVHNALPVGLDSACSARGQYSDGRLETLTNAVVWTSSDSRVAVVSNAPGSKGRTSTVGEGITNIGAELDGVRGSLALRVIGAALASIEMTGPTGVPVGFEQQYQARALYRLGPDQRSYAVTDLAAWRSSDATAATVGDSGAEKGLVRSLRASPNVEITAAFGGQTGRMNIATLAARLVRLEIAPADPTIAVGLERKYTATGFFEITDDGIQARDVTGQVQWGTTDPTLASIDADGRLHARALGQVALVAQSGAVSASLQLSVVDKCVRTLVLNRSSADVPAGVPVRFTVTANYSNGSSEDVTSVARFESRSPANMAAPGSDGWTWADARATTDFLVYMVGRLDTLDCEGRTPEAQAGVYITAATLDEISVSDEFVPRGLYLPMHAIGRYSDGSTFDITRRIDRWETGSEAIALVSNDNRDRGLVYGVGQGSTPVVATQGVITGEGSITVTAAVLTAVRVQGFDTAGECRPRGDGTSWITQGFTHPAGGYTTWVRAIGDYSDGSHRDLTRDVVWTSSNESVAHVSNLEDTAGRVLAGAAGHANLTATSPSGHAGSLEFIAANLAADRIALNLGGEDPVRLALGYGASLELVGLFGRSQFCITDDGSYGTDTPAVATVENALGRRGYVHSEGVGSAIVSVYVGVLNDTLQVRVTDPQLEYVEVLPAQLSLLPQESASLQAYAHFSDGTVNLITDSSLTDWATDNEPVVSLNSVKGVVRALAVGVAHIDACTQGLCASDGAVNRRATVTVRH